MSKEGRKGKRLSSEDVELWNGVVRSVRPLRKYARKVVKPVQIEEAAPLAGKVVRTREPVRIPVKPPPRLPASPTQLERRLKQKIARGTQVIEGRLDLHGHTQAEAHGVLLRFLRSAHEAGKRIVLVITGKGQRQGEGVLRRNVPLWLALPEFRELVLGFDTASGAHGGEGALYVRLKKFKADPPITG